jgi:hypothetical protein
MSAPRIKTLTVVCTYEDGSTREAIVLDRPEIRQMKRTETEPTVHFLLDVTGVDVTPWQEVTAAQLTLPTPKA